MSVTSLSAALAMSFDGGLVQTEIEVDLRKNRSWTRPLGMRRRQQHTLPRSRLETDMRVRMERFLIKIQ